MEYRSCVIPVDGSIVYSATLLWAGMILCLSNPVEGNKNGVVGNTLPVDGSIVYSATLL
jgi:hypothetical protein